jgi:hypothetical protein
VKTTPEDETRAAGREKIINGRREEKVFIKEEGYLPVNAFKCY